ncbi:DUF732 domain-containing protein [Gordonia sp. i37]|uniref:DUF732 domain-containing protein n=1 Tax=Gordonia sp. i37 TaxID=1961707 RepID=UPI0009CC82E5|nr:DUF732 domain-containing protein [Gordonia sp. i37]OPX17151.1 DUF732 domain-containing protein [Gordonia sp. i37]
MMTKYLRLGVLMTGVVFALGSLAACSDDSTASAPITSNPVTTTSLYSAPSSASASSAPESGQASAGATPTTGGSTLPATTPGSTAPASGQLTAPDGAPLDDKAKRYLQALRSQNVTLLGDTDNGVALSLATYVCDAQKKNTDPVTTKGYVTALVAPGTQNTAEANAKADKVIKAAQDNYC